ncbi:hypothetical protein WR25_07356 [Diploscapter pachys]|uniref:MARVEL domain-containing protein n=1 Tax=Diploscapter pachys TaxID=2018661 RepID=A0A2A2KB62_9BILA|nr:hypothetical protein WR25_07356 [Diploscapter pachys]
MAYPGSSGIPGAVKIIPASAFRHYSQQQHQGRSGDAGQHYGEPNDTYFSYDQEPYPVNASYYMGDAYNPAYLHEPYGQNAYIDSAYGDYGPSYPAYYSGASAAYPSAYGSGGVYPGAYGPSYPQASATYRAFPQPQFSPRRSRAAPYAERARRPFSVDALSSRRHVYPTGHTTRVPTKKPTAMYRKRRDPYTVRYNNVQETDFGGGGTFANYRPYEMQSATLRRLGPSFYSPSYTTYPPSIMMPKRVMNTKRYPLFARVAMKAAQLILGAAVIGLVLSPMRGTSFHSFVIQTATEWQGLVVGIASAFSILTVILLLTSFLSNSVHAWRKLDALITAAGCLGWLLAAFVEAYFAACYPPQGARINRVCHRAEWIIATILCFINVVLYVIDFTMSWLSGVTIL